jgi:histone deacetylase complex subunit SAP18
VYDARGKEPAQEIQLHTWMDATLREIADLLKAAMPSLNDPCRLMFRIVYPDKFGRMVIRTAGSSDAIENIHVFM